MVKYITPMVYYIYPIVKLSFFLFAVAWSSDNVFPARYQDVQVIHLRK